MDKPLASHDNGKMSVCRHIRVAGRVQGVGFRYTAQSIASNFPIAGYVRNLPDGDVELLAEGDPAAVEGFLQAVRQRMSTYIRDWSEAEEPATGLQGFRIRY